MNTPTRLVTFTLLILILTGLAGCATTHFTGPLDITDAGSASAPALVINSDTDTGLYSIGADNLGIAVAGALDFDFAANDFTAASGSVISTNTINETTAGSGVTIDGLTIKDTGFNDDFTVTGTTPTITIGDAGAEDTALIYDGNAQDFYIGLDDSADDLVIGLGSTVGTTPIISADENQDVTFAQRVIINGVEGADSAATNETLEIAFTSPVDTTGTNTHNALTIDLAIGNATGGTNAVRALQIDGITGDAEVTETAINVGAGWDRDINADTSLEVGVDGTTVATVKDPATADAGTTTDSVNVALTTPVDTTGTNVHRALALALTIGNSTGGTNSATALAIDNITGDAQVTETGVLVGTGYDIGIDLQGTCVDLDAAGTTSICADTDNTIDFELNGADDFQMTANTLTVRAGSDIIAENATNAGVLMVAENTFTYTDTSNKTMFVIPANANIVDITLVITTASSGGGTDDTIECGYTAGTPTEYVNDVDSDAGTSVNRMGDAADMPFADVGDVGASDVTVLCKFVENTGTATAGAFRLMMAYAID